MIVGGKFFCCHASAPKGFVEQFYEHISDFTTWDEADIENVAHCWGAFGSGGNGWGSHSTRPVPISYTGDDGCLEPLEGVGLQVLRRPVPAIC